MNAPSSPRIRQPILNAPSVIIVSLVVLTTIYVAMEFLSPSAYEAAIVKFGLVPARVSAFEWSQFGLNSASLWTFAPFVTYAFLHGGFTHLAVNALAFLIFGTIAARRVGTMRFLSLSLVTSVAAALTHYAIHWSDTTPVIGASGAIAGQMGAASRFMFYDPKRPPTGPGYTLPIYSRPVVLFALVWVVLNAGMGLTGFSPDGSQDLTAWEAHIGGFFAGLLLFPLFDRRWA